MNEKMTIYRGDVLLLDLGEVKGSEQGGLRPVVCIQNDIGNKFSPTIQVAIITSKINKCKLPTQVLVGAESGIEKDSVVLCEQIRTVSKERIIRKVAKLTEEKMKLVDEAIKISFALKNVERHEEKIAREKSESIKDLDKFIRMWLDKHNNIDSIMEYIDERVIKIKELKRYCDSFNLNPIKYYDERVIHLMENKKMVG